MRINHESHLTVILIKEKSLVYEFTQDSNLDSFIIKEFMDYGQYIENNVFISFYKQNDDLTESISSIDFEKREDLWNLTNKSRPPSDSTKWGAASLLIILERIPFEENQVTFKLSSKSNQHFKINQVPN